MKRLFCIILLSVAFSAFAQSNFPVPQISFFVTSIGSASRPNDSYVGANLGGLSGADAFCTELAVAAGITGKTWHAYLSTSTFSSVSARDRIGAGPWYNARGQLIATNLAQLHAQGIPAALALDERGNPVPPNEHSILTGANSAGGSLFFNANAADFTSSAPDWLVSVGHSDGGGVGAMASPPQLERSGPEFF